MKYYRIIFHYNLYGFKFMKIRTQRSKTSLLDNKDVCRLRFLKYNIFTLNDIEKAQLGVYFSTILLLMYIHTNVIIVRLR